MICKMLNAGAEPSACLINQSTEIRMCALGLTNHQLRDSIPAAAAMVGIMKGTIKICHWISENNVPFDAFDVDLDNDFELGRQVRLRTICLMISILEKSPVSASAAEHKAVKEKSFSGNIIDGDDIAPAEAANMTGCNTQDQEKITGTDISKKRSLEGADKEADHQEVGICRNGSRLSKRGGRHHYLGHGDDHGVPLRLEYLTGSSDDIRKNQMEICTDEDRMVLDSSIEDLEEGDDAKTVPPPVGIVKFADVFEKTWGWDRLLPLKSPIEWSDYCNYLRQYYKCNANVVADVTGSLVASAEVCLKKEEELVSLWNARVVPNPIAILPVNTIVQSNLIQEHAHSVIFAKDQLPVASSVAFACINKETDVICELLKHDAEPTDGIIQQSSVIRMCALSLMHLQGPYAIEATAAMLGITKECKLMCDWMKKKDNLITFGFFTCHELEECRLIRVRTLDVLLSILMMIRMLDFFWLLHILVGQSSY
ncbi:unnamed protein product [Urochloa decumbens]|uniref:Uncharacterized protein n=1 Tax=Urochloa decumbens TaxID=240449 RepID=A0ABC9BEI2_9POAL